MELYLTKRKVFVFKYISMYLTPYPVSTIGSLDNSMEYMTDVSENSAI